MRLTWMAGMKAGHEADMGLPLRCLALWNASNVTSVLLTQRRPQWVTDTKSLVR